MDISPIVYAIPVFFLLIAFEFVASILLKKRVYRVTDTVNDLSLGMIDQVGGAFIASIMFTGYILIWTNFRVFNLGGHEGEPFSLMGCPWWVWVVCFIGKDFAYYWAHRMSHEMNVGWATHIAHHQSEEYNLSVALRQGVFQGFFFNIFYFPLALLGFPPAVFGLCSIINTLYQFWIHTRLVPKLGPVEWIMNTPSHHRVHHGRDLKYIDRNHAGVFIIWDRMFGTFQEEEEEPNYGLVSPLRSWNPLWGQVHYIVKLVKTSIAAPQLMDKFKLWFMAPSWQPAGLPAPPSSQERWARGELKRYETRTPWQLKLYVVLHFVPVNILVTGWLKGLENNANLKQLWLGHIKIDDWTQAAITAALIIWTLLNFGAIFECRKWVVPSELARMCCMAGTMHFMGVGYFGWPELDGAAFMVVNGALFAVSLLIIAVHWRDFHGVEIIEPSTEGPMYGPPETAEA